MHPLKTQKTNVFRARKSEDSTCHMCQCQILDLSVSDKQMICVETLEGGKTPKYTTFLALRIKPCNILRAKVRFLKILSLPYLPSEQVGGQISHLPTAKLNRSTSYHAVASGRNFNSNFTFLQLQIFVVIPDKRTSHHEKTNCSYKA